MKLTCKALKQFPYAPDPEGVQTAFANTGDIITLDEDIVMGLEIEGFVEVVENADNDDVLVLDDDEVEIPEDWKDLPWLDLRALATEIAGTAVSNKAKAVSVIEDELEVRG